MPLRKRAWSAASHYSQKTLDEAKRLGIAPHEVQLWAIEFRADELAVRHTPRTSVFPEGVRKLAAAVLESARDDLRAPATLPYYRPPEYRPDPYGARAWFQDITSDHPFSLGWVCQVLRFDPEAVRAKVFPRKEVRP